jgi:SAM-dependent methyltransferase
MEEIYRVLKPGGVLNFLAPSTEGNAAGGEPNQVGSGNDTDFARVVERVCLADTAGGPSLPMRFRAREVRTGHRAGRPYVEGVLEAIKDPLEVPPEPTYWAQQRAMKSEGGGPCGLP